MSANDPGSQTNLFLDAGTYVVYEQPLKERIRTCLRLEHLFVGIQNGIEGSSEWDSRRALNLMLEVSDLLNRSDIKGALIKELERDSSVLAALRDNPGVDATTLSTTFQAINGVLKGLKATDYQPGTSLRSDELVNQVRQRISIPGGTCSFDTPALHNWLRREMPIRAEQMNEWMMDLIVVRKAVTTILQLIRESVNPLAAAATSGFYQQQLEAGMPCQIVRVLVDPELNVFPEISGGKHRFTVRFYEQNDTAVRPAQVKQDIAFELQCCGI